MKRILAAALSLALLVSLAACGGKDRFDTGKVEEGVCYQLTGIAPDAVAMKVDVSEMMGSAVHLHSTMADGKDVVIIVQTMDMNGHELSSFSMGSTIHFSFGGNVAHVFSKETEKNLEW
mgnify:CR=1 FL=1